MFTELSLSFLHVCGCSRDAVVNRDNASMFIDACQILSIDPVIEIDSR